jgi:uncharacterized membrane protein
MLTDHEIQHIDNNLVPFTFVCTVFLVEYTYVFYFTFEAHRRRVFF